MRLPRLVCRQIKAARALPIGDSISFAPWPVLEIKEPRHLKELIVSRVSPSRVMGDTSSRITVESIKLVFDVYTLRPTA